MSTRVLVRLGLVSLVCGGIPSLILLGGFSADAKPWASEARLANLAKEVVIPLEATRRQNPLADHPQAAIEGMELYQRSCSECHGSDGRSDIPFGRAMYPPAMDLTSPHVRKWRDAELFWIIENGVRFTGMPAWHSIIDEQDAWRLVMVIRKFQQAGPKAVEQTAVGTTTEEHLRLGAVLYRQENCYGCHQLHGEGGRVGPDLTTEGDRARSNEWLVGHFRNPGAYVKGSLMPATSNLNDAQLQALTEFLQSQHGK